MSNPLPQIGVLSFPATMPLVGTIMPDGLINVTKPQYLPPQSGNGRGVPKAGNGKAATLPLKESSQKGAAMTDTGASLLRAILDDPASDDRRLIYADWLDDQGEAERAEFVRVQIALSTLDPYHRSCTSQKCSLRECNDLRRRERELLMSLRPDGWNWKLPYYPRTDHCNHARATMQCEAVWRRGFIDEVRCRIADWIGTECVQCSGRGCWPANQPQRYVDGIATCAKCHGLGRVGANGPAIVACQPVTRVVATDMPVFQSGGNDTFYVGGLGRLPQEYWSSLEGLPSRQSALAALSAALVRLARDAAGLPLLQELKTARTTP